MKLLLDTMHMWRRHFKFFLSMMEALCSKAPEEVCVVGVLIAGGAVLPAALIVPKPNSNLTIRSLFDEIAGKK